MSETKQNAAYEVAREAKGLNLGLQEALKTKDPWEKEIEFQRKDLRRRYVRLLLILPYAKESKEAETRLWIQTSYAFITIYKNRISRLDPNGPPLGPRQSKREAHGTVVEYRKLLSRFRQFLAEEERFWTNLILRFRRSFGLDELHPALVALELISPDVEDVSDTGGRGQNLLPPEDGSVRPSNPEQHQNQLSIASKVLVCLGDIARYREQYNEKGGRPKAGQDVGPPAKKNGKKQLIPRSRDYEKAQQRYEQARALVPSEGNPSHQLAILASYQRDTFGSLVHYYRALCVQQPYETAAENMEKALTKALDYWKLSPTSRLAEQEQIAPQLRIDSLKEKIIILHAYWVCGNEELDGDILDTVLKLFRSLVSKRLLSTEIISKVIILAHGAIWKHRKFRLPGGRKKSLNTAIEAQMATHLLAVHRVLLEVGSDELGEAPPEDSEDLAQNITATFRRTLPALRLASKWIRANHKYFATTGSRHLPIEGITEFWEAYTKFSSALERRFPLESLPHLIMPLEEDLDVKGFLPLTKLMATGAKTLKRSESTTVPREQVHPNEEQLMRLWDLLTDAMAIVESPESPIVFQTNEYFVKGQEMVRRFAERNPPGDIDEDTEGSRTDDDPISAAFRKVLEGSEDDDEQDDEIVWDPRASMSPHHNVFDSKLPSPLVSPPSLSPKVPLSLVPTHVHVKPSPPSPIVKPVGTTAQDLLNNVMGLPANHAESTMQSSIFHGSNSPIVSSHSIWSTSASDPKHSGVSNHHQRSRSQYASPSSPFPISLPPSGSSQLPWQSHNSPIHPVGQPSSPFLPHQNPIGHHRMQSTSLSPAYAPSSPQQRFEPFSVTRPPFSSMPDRAPFANSAGASLDGSSGYPIPPSRQGFTDPSHTASYISPEPQQLWGNVG